VTSAQTDQTQKSQIVHESETQRQFIRLKMPAQAEMNGARYGAKDISSGGMAIQGMTDLPKKGSRHKLKLVLPFFDFALDIDLTAEVIHVDKKENSVGVRFIDMTSNQVSMLNHVLSAFIAGDVVSSESLLNVVSRDNFVKVRKHNNQNEANVGKEFKKYFMYGVFGLLTLGLSLFIINNILDKLTVVRSAQAFISAPIIKMDAAANGVFVPAIPANAASVQQGQVIGSIALPRAAGSETVAANAVTQVVSPCDCLIKTKHAADNAYIAQGAPMFTLIPRKAEVTVSAYIPMEQASQLKAGTPAKIRVSGSGQQLKGVVQDITVSESPAPAGLNTGAALQSLVIIAPETAISPDEINKPAFVEFYL